MASAIDDTSRLAIHTITVKPLPFDRMLSKFVSAGVHGITIWPDAVETAGAQEAAKMLGDTNLRVCALARGGFFPALDAHTRQQALDMNRERIDLARALGAPVLVLVCGAVKGQPLKTSRAQIGEGIAAILPHAEQAGVRLAIEPLHPMYADDRCAINTLKTANDVVDAMDHPALGVCVDVYHTWWDPDLPAQIERAGKRGSLFAFHVCDWRTPTRNLYTDRGLMGEGCIDIPAIRGYMEAAGFDGMHEVEIFSDEYWAMDQEAYIDKIVSAYRQHV